MTDSIDKTTINTSGILPSRRLRATPFTKAMEKTPPRAYTIYNHMFLPAVFNSLQDDYHHLKNHVQIWDVSVERQVLLKGKDARRLAVMMTPRDLRKARVGRCYYAPLTNAKGGIINDPLVLCLDEDEFSFSIADSDVLLWVQGLAQGLGLDVEVTEPDVNPLAIQGPRADDLMAEVFGHEIRALKFFDFAPFEFQGVQMNIGRSGWSKQGGFEIYLNDSALGEALWNAIMLAGAPYNIRAGCPNLIERIEGGLFSYGNDMTTDETPLEVGLDAYCNLDAGHDFIGKEALLKQREEGVKRRIMGVRIEGAPMTPVYTPLDCFDKGWRKGNRKVGFVTSGVYSPDFDANLGFAMLDIDYAKDGALVEIAMDGERRVGRVCPLPFNSY